VSLLLERPLFKFEYGLGFADAKRHVRSKEVIYHPETSDASRWIHFEI